MFIRKKKRKKQTRKKTCVLKIRKFSKKWKVRKNIKFWKVCVFLHFWNFSKGYTKLFFEKFRKCLSRFDNFENVYVFSIFCFFYLNIFIFFLKFGKNENVALFECLFYYVVLSFLIFKFRKCRKEMINSSLFIVFLMFLIFVCWIVWIVWNFLFCFYFFENVQNN